MKGLLRICLFILLTGSSIVSFSQDRERAEQFRLEAEQRKRSQILQVLDSAVVLMNNGNYALLKRR